MSDAVLDNIGEFLYIKDIEAGDCLITVLLLDIFLDIGFEVREEVCINFVIAEVEDILDGLLHLADIQSLECFVLDALDVELIVYFFLDVAAIGLQVDQQSFPRLLDLVHQYNYFQPAQNSNIHLSS